MYVDPRKRKKAALISKILDRLYPNPEKPLNSKDAFTHLVAVVLSARSTDKKVNEVTPALFKLAGTPEKMAKQKPETVRQIIREVGLSPGKAKRLVAMSKILVKKYKGKVPSTFEDLESLPGVGHKTASVIMCQIFGVPAFPVDTHIHRLAKRWGLSSGRNEKQTEKDLKAIFPREKWTRLHLQIIYFGRQYCKARPHDLKKCPICSRLAA